MPLLSHPAFTAKASLAYLTIGAILDVWSSVWFLTYSNANGPMEPSTKFWLIGFFLTGIVLMLIGLLMGPLGRSARQAELPPQEAIQAETIIQKKAAATPDLITPVSTSPEATHVMDASSPNHGR